MPVDLIAHQAHANPTSPSSPISNWLSVVSHLDPRYGGLSAVVPHLASLLTTSDRFHVQLDAFCLPHEHSKPEGYPALPVTFWPASRKSWLLDRSLSRIFRRSVAQSDGVHIHGLWEQSTRVAARTARALGKPYIVSAHGMLQSSALADKRARKQLYAALFERRNLEGAACLHALTRAEARNYRDFGCKRPIATIPYGVDVPAVLSPALFLQTFPFARNKRLILFLGKVHEEKGVDRLIRAWAKVGHGWPDSCLVLAGPSYPAMRARLEKLASDLGVSHRILFTGNLLYPEKWSALAAAECFVLPSHSEGLSVSVLEAMGAGVPVIVTENCNLPEVVEGNAGWQTSPRVEDIAAALELCLSNSPEANQHLGQNGTALIRERYTWSGVAAQMGQLYTWVQGGSKGDSVPEGLAIEMC
jgi:glycosyltransferase involved in cell wall biosynthesis